MNSHTVPAFWYKHLLFALATAAVLLVMGYHFGSFDQASHIPFLRHMADPSLYPGDPFIALRLTKYSYFWQLFIPFLRAGILEYTLFSLYVVSVYLTFDALWRLSLTLFASWRAAALATIVFVFPHIGLGFVPVFEFSVVNRIVVLPFLLWAIVWYLQKRYIFAFAMVGIVANFHVLTAIFVAGMFGWDFLMRAKEIGIATIGKSALVFLLTASPVLLWKFSSTSGAGLHANPIWFGDIAVGFLGHLYNLFGLYPPYIVITMSGLCFLYFCFRFVQSFSGAYPHRVIQNFLVGVAVVVSVHIVTTYVYPSEFFVQFQLIRIGVYALIFFYLYAAAWLASQWEREKKRKKEWYMLFAFLLLSPFPFFFLVGKAFYEKKQLGLWGVPLLLTQGVVVGVLLFATVKMGVVHPGIYIFARKTPSYLMQQWVSEYTPKSARIIAPPYLWEMYDVDFRVFAQRTPIATWSELLELVFNPEAYDDWVSRFDDVAPGARKDFPGFFLENQTVVKNAYTSLAEEDVKRLKEKYQASYFVTEKQTDYSFPLVYENSVFRVYDLQGVL